MEKKDLLDKWLNGELTPEEFEVFKTIPEYSSYLKIDAFVKDIDLPVRDNDAALQAIKSRTSTMHSVKEPKVFSLRNFAKIAAVLTVLLASYFFISNYTNNSYTQYAEMGEFTLPDNSVAVLNNSSELKFRNKNWEENRIVQLSGEAFFNVEKGSTFKVETSIGLVTVLGTEFDVYAKDGAFSVSCYEGLVRVTQNDISVELPAGKMVTLVKGNLELDEVYTAAPGWIYNESIFDDTEIEKVLTVLEKQFNLQLTTKNIDVNLRFTGGFPNDDLEAALQAITIPLNLNYSIENKDAVTIFGKVISK